MFEIAIEEKERFIAVISNCKWYKYRGDKIEFGFVVLWKKRSKKNEKSILYLHLLGFDTFFTFENERFTFMLKGARQEIVNL